MRDTNVGEQQIFGGLSPVGFGEIRLRDDAPVRDAVVVREIDADADGPAPGGRHVVRAAPAGPADEPRPGAPGRRPGRTPRPTLVRRFTLPTARDFAVAGAAPALSRARTTSEIDRTLGYTGPVVATSSARLVDAPSARASSALDHDPSDRVGDAVPQRGRLVDRRRRRARPAPSTTSTSSSSPTAATRCRPRSREQPAKAQRRTRAPRRAARHDHAERDRARRPHGSRRSPARASGSRSRPCVRCSPASTTAGATSRRRPRSPSSACPASRRSKPPAQLPTTCRTDVLTIDGPPCAGPAVGDHGRGGGAPTGRRHVVRPAHPEPARGAPRCGTPRGAERRRRGRPASTSTGSSGRAARVAGSIRRLTPNGTVAVRSGGAGPSVHVLRSGRADVEVEVAPSHAGVVARARPEPERRMEGDGQRSRRRRLHARRRVRERLAAAATRAR